jgi:hypothetical protein
MIVWTADNLLGRYLVTADGIRWRIYWLEPAIGRVHGEVWDGAKRVQVGHWEIELVKAAVSGGLMNLE